MLLVKTSFANVAASQTDSNIISLVQGKRLRVIGGWVVNAGTAMNVTFNSKGTGAGTAITSLIPCGANGGLIFPSAQPIAVGEAPYGYFESNKDEGITVTTSAGATIMGITLRYLEV